MTIEKDETLEISQVGNGFIVRRAAYNWFDTDKDRRMWTGEKTDYLVFRTMAELQNWLGEHFSHRARPNWPDVMPTIKPAVLPKKAAA